MPLTPLPIDPDVTKMVARAQDGTPLTFAEAVRVASLPEQDLTVVQLAEARSQKAHARKIAVIMASIAWRRGLRVSPQCQCRNCHRDLQSAPEQTSELCTACVRRFMDAHAGQPFAAVFGQAVSR